MLCDYWVSRERWDILSYPDLANISTDLGLICLLKTDDNIEHVFIYRAYALEAEPNDD